MTEQEYINVCDLQRITDAKNILRDVLPETSNIITSEDKAIVFKILNKWQDELFKAIKIKQ